MSSVVGQLFATRALSRRSVEVQSLHALAILLMFVQLPHLVHLPLWVDALALALIGIRLYDLHHEPSTLRQRLLSPFALAAIATLAALAIRADYGYFVGRDPCVAFLSVLVAAKFAEVRNTSDTTLLLCLAGFLLLTQYFYSQTILAALVTLPAVIALANALIVIRDPLDNTQTGPRLRLAIKLLAQGLPIAALLFVVFPRLPGPLWSLPEDGSAQTGLSESMQPGSIGELSKSDAVAFRVEFDELPPVSSQRYWRGPVLERFDGQRWSATPRKGSHRLPDPATIDPATRLDYTVMLQPHRNRWLFALDQAVTLPQSSNDPAARSRILGEMSSDGQLLATDPVTQVLRYRQSSVPGTTFEATVAPGPETLSLAGRNPRTVAFASRLRSTATGETDYADKVLEHFRREPFVYTLRPGLLGDASVDEFLFDTRRGFCEHYASSFVVLMRAAGIPARVVTGYLGGQMNGDYMIVRQADAHAWAEAWIDGAWQRYEPTGAVAPDRIDIGLAAALPDSDAVPRLARGGNGWMTAAGLRWDSLNHAWQRLVVDFDDAAQSRLRDKLGIGEPALWQLMVAVLLTTGVWSAFVLGLPWQRAGRRMTPVERQWQGFTRTLARRGIVRRSSESPAEFVERASQFSPRERESIARVGAALIALRFAPPDDQHHVTELKAVRRECQALALAVAPPFGKWRHRH